MFVKVFVFIFILLSNVFWEISQIQALFSLQLQHLQPSPIPPLPPLPPLPLPRLPTVNVTVRCANQPNTSRKVEASVRECQSEVQNTIIVEALKLLRASHSQIQSHQQYEYERQLAPSYNSPESSYYPPHTGLPVYPPLGMEEHLGQMRELHSLGPNWPFETRRRRSDNARSDDYDFSEFRHPTTVPFPDKRIAGCLLHCVFVKNNAVNKLGWPTLDGLVNFYTEGVNEHGYFMATLRASDYCLKGASNKYNINRMLEAGSALSCDIAFDVFDCISDQIIDYCNERPTATALSNISNQFLRP